MQHSLIDDDGQPSWHVEAGAGLVPGVLAWDRLGVGHRCETWLGWSEPLWSPVVVKLPRPHQQAHPRARLALAREVAALQNNPHPVLPRLMHAELDAPMPYVVFEHIDGDALDSVVDDAPLDPASTARLAVQLLSALVVLHRRGIAHLDIKPENVMVRGGRPTLVDFGSARRLGSLQPVGHPVGTVGYAAPEMEACDPVSAAMDVYGVGATLREAFSGQSVYDVDPRRRREAANPTFPAGNQALVALIGDMLATSPADRPTVPAALDSFAALFEAAERPWPEWVSAVRR